MYRLNSKLSDSRSNSNPSTLNLSKFSLNPKLFHSSTSHSSLKPAYPPPITRRWL